MLRAGVVRCRQSPSCRPCGHHPEGVSFPLSLPTVWSIRRVLSTPRQAESDTDDTSEQAILSKRKQFKQIAVDQKVLRHLDQLGLGMEKKNVERIRKMRSYERGAVSSAFPGVTGNNNQSTGGKPVTFDHPTWAMKRLASASTADQVPTPDDRLPEVALVGRSNVGKSTLLNALLGLQSAYHAKSMVSERPGTTRALEFYRMGKGRRAKFIIADMPGFGFAYADEAKRDEWKGLMMAYLRGRGAPLKRVMLLLDARHGFKKADIEFLEQLYDSKGPSPLGKYKPPKIQILLTKCDLVKRLDLARRVTMVRQQLDDVSRRQTNLPTMMLSALRGQGLVELQRELSALDPQPTVVPPTRADSTGGVRTAGVSTIPREKAA